MPGPQSDPTVWPRTLFLLGVFQENVRRCQLRVPAQFKECNHRWSFTPALQHSALTWGFSTGWCFNGFKREQDGGSPDFHVNDAHFEPTTSDGTFGCLLTQHSPTYFFGDIFLDAAEKRSCSLELGIHISIIGDRYLQNSNPPKRLTQQRLNIVFAWYFPKWRERQLSVAGNVLTRVGNVKQCHTSRFKRICSVENLACRDTQRKSHGVFFTPCYKLAKDQDLWQETVLSGFITSACERKLLLSFISICERKCWSTWILYFYRHWIDQREDLIPKGSTHLSFLYHILRWQKILLHYSFKISTYSLKHKVEHMRLCFCHVFTVTINWNDAKILRCPLVTSFASGSSDRAMEQDRSGFHDNVSRQFL